MHKFFFTVSRSQRPFLQHPTGRYLQQIAYYPRKINVADDHYVELLENFEFLQIYSDFAVGLRCSLQMLDGPNDRKQYQTATYQIQQKEQLAPSHVDGFALFFLFQKYVGRDGQNLRGKKIEFFAEKKNILKFRLLVMARRSRKGGVHFRSERIW